MKKIFTKRRIIWGSILLVIVALVLVGIFKPKGPDKGIVVEAAKVQDLKSTVLATGQVTSNVDLNLSFKASGIVRKVNVKVGDKVKANQLLANLDQRDQSAALTSARGALALAQANYEKIVSGSSSEEVDVAQKAVDAAQVALDNTKKQQDLAVSNSYRALLNSTLEAVPSNNIWTGTATVSGSFTGLDTGTITVKTYTTGDGLFYSSTGLGTNGSGQIVFGLPLYIGQGLYITFSSSSNFYSGISFAIAIPNTQAITYTTNYNAYQAALNNRDTAVAAAQSSLDSAVAALNLRKAQARPADIQAAQAQILSAQGQVQAATAAVENTEIRAGADGTVTKVDLTVGELVSALTPVIVVQDVNNMYLEANISEANVSSIKQGQRVSVNFDALGADREYDATVQSVDPASTVVSGVVNYRVVALLSSIQDIKPGMTANMTIETGQKPSVLAVPSRAVISKDGKKYIRVITDEKKKTYEEREVQTGFEGDGGLVEITSGISAGQSIVTFIPTK